MYEIKEEEVSMNHELNPISKENRNFECLVTCTSSWVSEDSLRSSAEELIPSYWSARSSIQEIIKIEDIDDDDEEYSSDSCAKRDALNCNPLSDSNVSKNVNTELNSLKISDFGKKHLYSTKSDLQQKEPNGFKKYQCQKCKLNFDKYDSLQLHINSPLPCSNDALYIKTGVKTSNRSNLSSLVCGYNDDDTPLKSGYTCEICNLYFLEIGDLEHHLILHSIGSRGYDDQQCELSVEEEADLEKLRVIYNENEPYICPICCKGFSHNDNLQEHVLLHNLVTFVCQKCNQVFSNKPALMKHELSHLRDKTFHNGYSKEDGHQKADSLGSLEKPGRPFECLTCGKEFAHRYYLMNHEKVHKDKGQKPFTCGVCYQRFSFYSQLDQHNLVAHSGDKQFICDICPKAFSSRSNLKLHKMTHRRELAHDNIANKSRTIASQDNNSEVHFLCYTCGRHFFTIGMLQEHEKCHIQDRPKTFKCVLCMKAFTKHCDLKRHIMTHTGEKPFKCDICTKSFTRNSHLKTHKMIHTGEKPFLCPTCHKGFTKRCDMKKHFMCHRPLTHPMQTLYS